MKILVAIALALAVLAPVSANALNPGECARLMRQIYHYKMLEDRAAQLQNDVYVERMEAQQGLLQDRYDERCDGFSEDDHLIKQAVADFAKAVKVGAVAAAKWFSMGAF